MGNNNNFFYNGYDDNSQDNTRDPFSDKKTFYDPDSGVYITNEEPKITVATPKDGRSHYISSLILGVIITLFCAGVLTSDIVQYVWSSSFVESAAQVQGVVTKVTHISSRSRGRKFTTTYLVHYRYIGPDGQGYEGSDTLSAQKAAETGYNNNSRVGTVITVYCDPENPKRSVIMVHDPGWFQVSGEIIGLIAGIGLLINGIRIYRAFSNGEYVVEDINGKKKIRLLKDRRRGGYSYDIQKY